MWLDSIFLSIESFPSFLDVPMAFNHQAMASMVIPEGLEAGFSELLLENKCRSKSSSRTAEEFGSLDSRFASRTAELFTKGPSRTAMGPFSCFSISMIRFRSYSIPNAYPKHLMHV
ncbi:hypothetical protein E3N88_32190 [Mikania micrantha]|uniref:Uncharacterized protein n=1 Tax=Mikania micrantha TaxID=192012 RepID=A0A5N6M8Z9_9ASTR|nr:hypothetical protein E3N88_32190 [Mikania micrantha]